MFALIAGLLLAVTGSAAAQDVRPNAPALEKPPAGDTSSALPNTGENLSSKLDRSDGVISPPGNVDPGISASPKEPNAGSSMPVIRPPSNSQVTPK
jgi:hypothetical protein